MATVPSIVCPGCKKSFKGKPELVGKKIRCPSCKNPFVVPAAPSPTAADDEQEAAAIMAEEPAKPIAMQDDEEDGPDEYGVTASDDAHRCPQCANEMENEDAIICLHCGYNTQTRKWGTTVKAIEREYGDWFSWHFPAYACLFVFLLSIWGGLYYCLVLPYNLDPQAWYAFIVDHESTRLYIVIFGLGTMWSEGWVIYYRLIIHPIPPEKLK